jgi:hypothetical protein
MHPSFQSFPNVLDSTKVCMAWMLVKMGTFLTPPQFSYLMNIFKPTFLAFGFELGV